MDTDALTEALQTKQIAGAALDVTGLLSVGKFMSNLICDCCFLTKDPEPLPRNHPMLSIKENLIIAPHIGSATYYARSKMFQLSLDNLLAGLNDQPLKCSTY